MPGQGLESDAIGGTVSVTICRPPAMPRSQIVVIGGTRRADSGHICRALDLRQSYVYKPGIEKNQQVTTERKLLPTSAYVLARLCRSQRQRRTNSLHR